MLDPDILHYCSMELRSGRDCTVLEAAVGGAQAPSLEDDRSCTFRLAINLEAVCRVQLEKFLESSRSDFANTFELPTLRLGSKLDSLRLELPGNVGICSSSTSADSRVRS